jgi:hypothetical protein
LLAGRGITRLQRAHGEEMSLLVVRTGLTVWARDSFYWQDREGRYLHRAFADVQDVAERLVQRHEEYNDRDRTPTANGLPQRAMRTAMQSTRLLGSCTGTIDSETRPTEGRVRMFTRRRCMAPNTYWLTPGE